MADSHAPAPLRAVLARAQASGLLGPGPVLRHVELAEAFLAANSPPEAYVDLGSGGGVPGLVLALRWPAARGVLVDAQARRVAFLREAIEELALVDRVVAVHGRAEDLARSSEHRGRYPVATARSFGPPGVTAECGAGFLLPHGALLVAEPPDADADRWPPDGLAQLGLVDEGTVRAGGGTVRRLRSQGAVLDAVPRRPAALTRAPRF